MGETSKAHKKRASKHIDFGVVVCSTSRYQDLKEGKHVIDKSGDLIVEAIQNNGHTVALRQLVPDDKVIIEKTIRKLLKSPKVDAVITCGGTGISPTDVTIETVQPLLEKELPGIGEIFRVLSYEAIGSSAVMTRTIGGLIQGKAIFCIPGSPQAVKLCLEKLILPEAAHIILHARGK